MTEQAAVHPQAHDLASNLRTSSYTLTEGVVAPKDCSCQELGIILRLMLRYWTEGMKGQLMRLFLLVTTILLSAACGDGIPVQDLYSYSHPPPIGDIDLNQLQPRVGIRYVELRFQWDDSTEPRVEATLGTLCADAADADTCEQEFRERIVDGYDDGFFHTGPHADMFFYYLAGQRADGDFLVGGGLDMLDFLGSIDNETEALLQAAAHGYIWSSDDLEYGAIRKRGNDYLMVVTKGRQGHHIRLKENGSIVLLQSWSY